MNASRIAGLAVITALMCLVVAAPVGACDKSGAGVGAVSPAPPAAGEDHSHGPEGIHDNAVDVQRGRADDASQGVGGADLPGGTGGNAPGVRFTGDGSIRGSHLSSSPGTEDGGPADPGSQTGADFLTQLLVGEAMGVYTKEQVDRILDRILGGHGNPQAAPPKPETQPASSISDRIPKSRTIGMILEDILGPGDKPNPANNAALFILMLSLQAEIGRDL